MKQRCDYTKAPNYMRYGGRGITYDPRWAEFNNFLSDMGERPAGHTLERRDSNGNYTKDNCFWATMKAQQNNRRNNIYLTVRGETKPISEWSRLTGLSIARIKARRRMGWPDTQCLCPDTSKRHIQNKEWGF